MRVTWYCQLVVLVFAVGGTGLMAQCPTCATRGDHSFGGRTEKAYSLGSVKFNDTDGITVQQCFACPVSSAFLQNCRPTQSSIFVLEPVDLGHRWSMFQATTGPSLLLMEPEASYLPQTVVLTVHNAKDCTSERSDSEGPRRRRFARRCR
jgi:hypothetical protein